jgi:hypothetical protein
MNGAEERAGNADLYARGRQYAAQIARRTADGDDRRAAIRRLAAESGREVAEVRSAVRFADAVNSLARNAGPKAKGLIQAGGRHLSPEIVMQVSRTHPDRQRFAMANVARGVHPFSKPPACTDPPFDTLGWGEVISRLARASGLLERVAEGLSATPAGDWPSDVALRAMRDHLRAVRRRCAGLYGTEKNSALAITRCFV